MTLVKVSYQRNLYFYQPCLSLLWSQTLQCFLVSPIIQTAHNWSGEVQCIMGVVGPTENRSPFSVFFLFCFQRYVSLLPSFIQGHLSIGEILSSSRVHNGIADTLMSSRFNIVLLSIIKLHKGRILLLTNLDDDWRSRFDKMSLYFKTFHKTQDRTSENLLSTSLTRMLYSARTRLWYLKRSKGCVRNYRRIATPGGNQERAMKNGSANTERRKGRSPPTICVIFFFHFATLRAFQSTSHFLFF